MNQQNVAVIGAGIVGTSIALNLLRRGHHVTIIERQGPGSGTSFGNAGMISPDSCVPLSIPGLLRKVPGYLLNPLGPLAIQPRYLPRVVPYLVRWMRAGKLDRVLKSSDAIMALQSPAFAEYEAMLGPAAFSELIRCDGQLYFWQDNLARQPITDMIWQRHGVSARTLSRDEVRDLVPTLKVKISHAILHERRGHAVNPYRVVCRLAAQVESEGGSIVREEVVRLIPQANGWRLITSIANRSFDTVVVAAGAWSGKLLGPLGYRFPLETERGYHATFPNPNIPAPPFPIICSDRPAAASPIDGDIRIAGTLEFAGLDAPMRPERAEVLVKRIKQIMPDLNVENHSVWMGHRPCLPDHLPIIDRARCHDGLILAFGHAHSGMTSGPQTGRLVADLVGRTPPAIDLTPFRSDRFCLTGAADAGQQLAVWPLLS
ncbi:NAD(P)/FAD-dependent oxidoreductase [Phyllobacterium sophorae]|uniref:FAD-binding oxidoreductase n=1 Tax=Phyllobacterium sophorae TaxID=1520277 RepID=A0A2P7AMY7_9HYPH|nr:FAD-dependent oxidoreductase [Phyllobacterium sophorae]PSH55577.1 FAD-binding oxidoreductase [Phyllobacterium sophorae]